MSHKLIVTVGPNTYFTAVRVFKTDRPLLSGIEVELLVDHTIIGEAWFIKEVDVS